MEARKRRKTRGIRTIGKAVPKMAVPVKALWESAPEAARKRAHETSAAILQYWLGKQSKQQTAETLGVRPLRVWQLSQQALSGMVAGLLKQPRKRRSAMVPQRPEDDPKVLKKRIAELERELEIAQDVIELLRDLPANREAKKPSKPAGKKKRPAKKKARPRRPRSDRDVAPDGTDPTA